MTSKGINWDTKKELLQWKDVAAEKQRFYYEFFRKRRWEMYEPPEFPHLKLKIGYALFGPPVDVKSAALDNFYSAVQKKKIEDIFNAMKKVNSKEKCIVVSFIFFISVIDNKYTEFPAFRVLKAKQGNETEVCGFVDSLGYLYKNWERFLATNVIPYCIYCYPKDGFYTCDAVGNLELEYSYCPQSYSLLSGVVSAVGTVGSAVGTVGSAVGTVLPGSKSGQAELLPVPLISIIKGVKGSKRLYWIPVTIANGSVDLYAVHCTHALAHSSQAIRQIPTIIADVLERGYINMTWYAVINEIENIIQHSNKTSYMHVAQVITSTLFFCHAVLSTDLTKQIIKEIRNDFSKNKDYFLDHYRKMSLEDSLEIDNRKPSEPVVKQLKFIDVRPALVSEMVEKLYQSNFIVPDIGGKYFTLAFLLENIKHSSEPNKYADILSNYCLDLENIVKNCENCSKALENKLKCTSPTKTECNDKLRHSKATKSLEQEIPTIDSNVNVNDIKETKLGKRWSFRSISFSTKNIQNTSPLKDQSPKQENILGTPLKGENKEVWLLTNVCNTTASPFITPPLKKYNFNDKIKESLKNEIADRNNPLNNETNDKPEIIANSLSTSTKKKDVTPVSKVTLANTTFKLNNTEIINEHNHNIKMPESKKYNKNVEPIVKSLNAETEGTNKSSHIKSLQKATPTSSPLEKNNTSIKQGELNLNRSPSTLKKNITYSNQEELKSNQNSSTSLSKTINISHAQKKESLTNNEPGTKNTVNYKYNFTQCLNELLNKKSQSTIDSVNLSGKSFEIVRENWPEKVDPLEYFKEFVHKELNNLLPSQFTPNEHEENSWLYVMPEEVSGVKLVKIQAAKSEGKEIISISYY